MQNKEESDSTLKPSSSALVKLRIDGSEEDLSLLRGRSAYIFCDKKQPLFYYAKYCESTSSKFLKSRMSYQLITLSIKTTDLELIKLFPEVHAECIDASKEALDKITEITGHTEITWLGSDPLQYQDAEDHDEHLALASIYSEGPHQDYYKAYLHYSFASQRNLAGKYLSLASENYDIRAFKHLGNAANQIGDYSRAIKYYHLTLKHSYTMKGIQYFCHSAVLNELIALYHRGIKQEWLFNYFKVLAPKGWPILYAELGKIYDDNHMIKQAIDNYSLFLDAYCESSPLMAWSNKYKQMDRTTMQNNDLENSEAMLRKCQQIERKVSLIKERLNVLESTLKRIGFFENQRTIQIEILQAIYQIKEAYSNIQTKDDADFPKDSTLKIIIDTAFSKNSKLKSVLEQLVYIDNDGNLVDSAPEVFKEAYEDYLKDNSSDDYVEKECCYLI